MDNLNEAEENARLRESLPNNYCPPIKFVSLVRSWGEKGVGSVGSMQEETRARIAIFPFS